MGIRYVDESDCTGCGACFNICPQDCIQIVADNTGFKYPKIDYDKCTQCEKCTDICPILNIPELNNKYETPEVFAAWSLNEDTRLNSTSGGIFSELAKYIISNNGYVVGAKYNDKHLVEHCMIDKIEYIEKLRQSKYIQSDINNIFKQIKVKLNDNKLVVFVGSPCQVAGLLNYLEKNYDNLTTIDFVCRGANSPKAYLKYIEMLENQYNSKVKKVWFKNKTYGWNRFSTRIDFENGEHYIQDRYTDLFMEGYIRQNLYMRESCFDCKFKTFPRYGDITLADFWRVKKELDEDKGTSLILLNSQRGIDLFEKIKDKIFCEESSLQKAKPGNGCMIKSVKKNPKADKFMKLLDEYPFDICFNLINEE